jgi:uncharacterized membrane protein YdjX (TVP38/TMEM64 family)
MMNICFTSGSPTSAALARQGQPRAGEFLTVRCAGGQAVWMSLETIHPRKKLPIAKLAIGGAVLAVVVVLALRGVKFGPLIDQGVDLIRDAGPVAFFVAMALLPAAGAPLFAFSLAAGEAFAARMTMTGVVATAALAIALNLALTYWLARYALRPLLARLVARYGYAVPRVTAQNALGVALLVRLTPGPPFFLQGYLLGLGEVPFRLYMIVSWVAVMPWAVSFIVLGKAAREGSFGQIGAILGGLVVIVVIVQVVRRKYAKREA